MATQFQRCVVSKVLKVAARRLFSGELLIISADFLLKVLTGISLGYFHTRACSGCNQKSPRFSIPTISSRKASWGEKEMRLEQWCRKWKIWKNKKKLLFGMPTAKSFSVRISSGVHSLIPLVIATFWVKLSGHQPVVLPDTKIQSILRWFSRFFEVGYSQICHWEATDHLALSLGRPSLANFGLQ